MCMPKSTAALRQCGPDSTLLDCGSSPEGRRTSGEDVQKSVARIIYLGPLPTVQSKAARLGGSVGQASPSLRVRQLIERLSGAQPTGHRLGPCDD